MLDPVVRLVRAVAPSFLSDVKSAVVSGKRLLRKSKPWTWARLEITPEGAKYKILYLGTEERQDRALRSLRRKAVDPILDRGVITISEFPLRSALRIPQHLDMDVPLHRSMEDILAGYG